MTSVLDVYVCWKLDLFLHFPIHNFLECTGHQLTEVADWITAKLLTRIPSQTLTYVDAEGDEIVINDVTPSSITEFLEVLLINGYHHVNVQCSQKPRDFTYEEFPFYGLVQVPEYFSRFQHLNKEETAQKLFLLEMRDIEEKQNILKEEAKRSLEQQAAVLRSYGQTVQVNTDFSCDIRYAEDGLCRHECKNAKVCFLNRDTKEVKSNGEEKKPQNCRPLRLFIRPNQKQQNTEEKLEKRFFEDALKQYPPARHESPRSRIADFLAELTAVSETKTGMSLCSGETHNVKAEKVRSIAQTQTDKVGEGKHIQTESYDSDDTSAEMSTVMYDLFANGAFRSLRKRTNSSKKCEMKRSTDSKKDKVKDSAIVDVKPTQKKETTKTVLPDQKISQDRINTKASGPSSHDRPRVSIIKEGALRKTLSDCGQLEYVTKSFRIHNIGKTTLENIKVKLIRFTPGVEECNCTNYVQSFSMRPDSTHRVTLNVTVKAKRTEPCVASFFVTAENGMVASPYLHVVVHPNIEETEPKKNEAKKLREVEQQTTTEQREAAQQTIAAEKREIEIQTYVSLKKEAEQQTVQESIEVKTAIPVFPIQSLQQRAALVVQQSTLMIAGKPTQLALPSPSARLALGAPEVRLAIQQTSESSESVDFESWFVQKDNSCRCEDIKQKNELSLDIPRLKSSSEMIALGVEEANRLHEEKDDDVMTAIGYDDEDEVKTAIPYEVDVYDELEITVAIKDDDVHTAIGYEDEDEVKTAILYEEDCELRTAVAYEEGDEVKTAIGLEERNDIDENEDDEVMTAIAYDEEEERERQLLENGDVEWQVTERDIRQAIYMATRGDLADNDDDVHTAIEAEPELELDETQSSGSSYESYEDGVDALNELDNGEGSDASDFEVISREAVDESSHY